MGFFQTFWSWLNGQLNDYIGINTAAIATVLEPAVVALATLYVMVWGFLQMSGRIEEPFATGIRRLIVLVVVLGVCLDLWLYNSVIVDTFYSAPAELSAAVVGARDPVATIDAIWQQGGAVGQQLWNNGGVWNGNFGFYIAGAMVWVLMGILCIYTMFLIALSSIALTVLLALGPLFVVLLLFESTRRYFEAWIAQLTNYALITVLTVLVAALLLQTVESYAAQTAARGTALLTVDALDMLLVAGLVLLLLRQIMPIAAGLAGGVALNSFGFMSRAMGWTATSTSMTGKLAAKELKALLAAGSKDHAATSASSRQSEAAASPSWRDKP